jgi:hypothetical protein
MAKQEDVGNWPARDLARRVLRGQVGFWELRPLNDDDRGRFGLPVRATPRPAPRPREHAPRSRRTRSTRRAGRDGPDLPSDDEDLDAEIEAVVFRCREVAEACGLAWIGDLVATELALAQKRAA